MIIRDGVIEGSTVRFLLAGDLSSNSVPLIGLLITRARGLGLSVTLDLAGIGAVEPDVVRRLMVWEAQGVTLDGSPGFVRRPARFCKNAARLR